MDNKIKKQYIFIGGTGRSGTNITRKILAEHSLVASLPFEYRFIIDPDGIIDFYNSFSSTWSPFMSDIKIKRLNDFLMNLAIKGDHKGNYKDWELSKWLPNYRENVEQLINRLKNFQYQSYWPGAKGNLLKYQIWFSEYIPKESLCRILGDFIISNINQLIKKKKKEIFVEDNTWNILFAKELSELVPQSKLIHVIRDPRDVIASFLKQSWCPSDCKQATHMYKKIIEQWFDIESKLSNSYFINIKLERLVANSEETIKKICKFIDLPYEENLNKLDLTKSNVNRWKHELSTFEKEILDSELSDILQRLGYNK